MAKHSMFGHFTTLCMKGLKDPSMQFEGIVRYCTHGVVENGTL